MTDSFSKEILLSLGEPCILVYVFNELGCILLALNDSTNLWLGESEILFRNSLIKLCSKAFWPHTSGRGSSVGNFLPCRFSEIEINKFYLDIILPEH